MLYHWAIHPTSRFIAPISSLSRALAPHVQWADWHNREGNKVSAFKFSLFYEEFQTLKTGFELFCGVTDHARSRFASVQAKLGAYYRKFLILGLNLRYDVLNLDFFATANCNIMFCSSLKLLISSGGKSRLLKKYTQVQVPLPSKKCSVIRVKVLVQKRLE